MVGSAEEYKEQKARRKKKKRFPVFWSFYFVFVVVLIIFWLCASLYVKKCLNRYEECLPERKMNQIFADIQKNGIENYLSIDGEISRFENEEVYKEAFIQKLNHKILLYKKSHDFQDNAPKYDLFAEEEKIGYASLKELSAERLIMILTVSNWDIDQLVIAQPAGTQSLKITVPATYQVMINGKVADHRELTDEVIIPDELSYAAEYVSVPSFVTYEVKNLLNVPNVQILDDAGNEVEYESEQKKNTTLISLMKFNESEMPSNLSDMVLENAKRYTNFFSVDLPGCKYSISPIKDMFPENSYYLELAETYRKEDMWTYSAHEAPVFKNEQVNHYIRYTDDLFSCEVYFDKEMKLVKMNFKKVDTTHFRFYYGRLNGTWKILDIKTLVEEGEG